MILSVLQNVFMLSVILSVVLCCVCVYVSSFKLTILSVVVLNVVTLNVEAPLFLTTNAVFYLTGL